MRPAPSRIHTSASADAWLVLSDTYYPGWVAVRRRPTHLRAAGDVLFRVVPVGWRARRRVPIRAREREARAGDQPGCAPARRGWPGCGGWRATAARPYNLSVGLAQRHRCCTWRIGGGLPPDHASRPLRGLAQRYVAGEDLADGIVVAQTLNTQGLMVSLDHLGESVTNAARQRAVSAYLEERSRRWPTSRLRATCRSS